MDIIRHGHHFRPAIARTPGGAVHPVATDNQLPALSGMTGIVTVGVVDTGLVLDDVTHPHPWIGNRASCTEEERDRLEVGHRDRHQPGYLADADGHGTFVTGLILHQAQTAHVIMRGVLDKDGDRANGLIDRDDVMVAEAVRELAARDDVKAKVKVRYIAAAFEATD